MNVRTGQTLSYRGDEPFAMMSTFKTYAVAALLHEHAISTLMLGNALATPEKTS